jgi:hypothetical protein
MGIGQDPPACGGMARCTWAVRRATALVEPDQELFWELVINHPKHCERLQLCPHSRQLTPTQTGVRSAAKNENNQ